MDNKKAVLNISISTVSRLVVLLLSLITRSILVKNLGEEANGIFALFTSIIGVLAVADLGIGTAITFSMYKPIVEDKKDEISALYFLYRKIYYFIFCIVLLIGFILTPFVDDLAGGQTNSFNVNINFLVYLVATSLTYIYAHKGSLITAYKDTYYITLIRSIGLIVESIVQIILVVTLKSFELFILSIFISNIIQWILTEILFNKKYMLLINNNKELQKDIRKEVFEKSKAMFYHKLGTVLVTTISNIIISASISVILLGFYSNYLLIMTGMISMISLIFSSITSVVGHTYVKDKNEFYEVFKSIYTLNIIVGIIFLLGYFSVIDGLIVFVFGDEFKLDDKIVILISINYFTQFMRNAVLTFRDATGTFYYDRYKPLVEGLISITLSIILVNYLGILGILISNIITNIFICHTIEPFVLYKYAFKKSVKNYYLVNTFIMILFGIAVLTIELIFKYLNFSNVLFKGIISVVFSVLIIILLAALNKKFRNGIYSIIKIIKSIKMKTWFFTRVFLFSRYYLL